MDPDRHFVAARFTLIGFKEGKSAAQKNFLTIEMIMSVHDPLARKRSFEDDGDDTSRRNSVGNIVKNVDSNKRLKEEDFNDKMYSLYVKNALEQLENNNDSKQIASLTTKINMPLNSSEAITIANFKIVLKILMANISKLDNTDVCNQLILLIIGYNWTMVPNDQDFKEIYSQFLLVLVSSIPNYLFKVLNKVVKEFSQVTSSELHHKILKNIIKFNPTALNKFPSVFLLNFPHHLATQSKQLSNYILNLLETLDYCEELQYDIWLLVIECCIKLDVELQNDLDDLDDDEVDDLINGASDDDDEDGDRDEDDDMESDDEEQREGQEEYLIGATSSAKNIKELVNKLDTIMYSLLMKTKDSFTEELLNNGKAVVLFNTLTSLFKSHILPTHFTKSIQFLLFSVSQYQPELSDSFLVLLIDITFSPNQILETRLKSMQYLSSFIARARNLTKSQIVFVVSYLIGWLNKYVDERESEINAGNESSGGMERFKLFYSTFQGLLYIFCFRYQHLQTDNEWEGDIDKFFQRVIITKFNPLKFIDETVCYIFANIATKLNVCYCYSIIEHNKRERMLDTNTNHTNEGLPSSVGNFKQKQEFLDLEAYFPFDPLVLPSCKAFIGQSYMEWSEVNPNMDEEDDESASGSNHISSDDEAQNSSDSDSDSDSESDNDSDNESDND